MLLPAFARFLLALTRVFVQRVAKLLWLLSVPCRGVPGRLQIQCAAFGSRTILKHLSCSPIVTVPKTLMRTRL